MHYALHSIKRGNRVGLQVGLATTFLMGVVFLGTQINEYFKAGFAISDGAFASVFYGLTGLHGAHVFVGLTLLAIMNIRTMRGHFTPDAHMGVECCGDLLALRRRDVDHRVQHGLRPVGTTRTGRDQPAQIRGRRISLHLDRRGAGRSRRDRGDRLQHRRCPGRRRGRDLGVVIGLFVMNATSRRRRCCWGSARSEETRRRILVLANETLAGSPLRARDREPGRRGGTLRSCCPALNVSKIKHWVSDEDEARRRRRSAWSDVARLAREGFNVKGDIGDADPSRRWRTRSAVPGRRGDHLDASARPLELARARRRRARTRAFPASGLARGRRPGARAGTVARREPERRRLRSYLTVRVPFIPACSWPGTLQ